MIDFLSIVLLIFGVLQIFLFFKMWGMTNDVRKIRNNLNKISQKTNMILLEAQMCAMKGEKEKSYELYMESFHKSVIDLFEESISKFGDKDNLEYEYRNEFYKDQYKKIIKYYNRRIEKLGMKLDSEKFDSYEKIYSYICES